MGRSAAKAYKRKVFRLRWLLAVADVPNPVDGLTIPGPSPGTAMTL